MIVGAGVGLLCEDSRSSVFIGARLRSPIISILVLFFFSFCTSLISSSAHIV